MSSPNPSHITYSSEKVVWTIVAKNNGSTPYNSDVKVALSWNHPVNYLRVSSDTDGMQGVQFGDGSAVGTVFNRTTSVWNVGPLSVGQEKRLYVETNFDALQNLDNLLPLILTKTLTLDSGNIPNNINVVSSDVLRKGVIPFPSEVDCSKVRYGPPGPPGPQGLDAYLVAVANGYVGSLDSWLLTLVGPQGGQGEQGIPGEGNIHTNLIMDIPFTGIELPLIDGVNVGDTKTIKFNNGIIVNYTWDNTVWVKDFEETEVYSLGADISQPFTNWTYTKTFVNGNETNITRWDVTSNTAKHKDARRIAGYYDRLALPISLDKDKLYRVDFEVTNYVGGSIAVNIGESFTFNASANGSYTDYVKTSNGDFIAIQSFGADLTITNIVVREVITQTQNFFGKIYSRDGIKTDGYIETGANKRILIGSWDNGTNFQDDPWQVYENNQPSISIGYNSMSRGTGVAVGPNAGKENTNLGYITAFGINALRRNTTGHGTAFGTGAAQNNTTGNICAFGDEALSSSTVSNNNAFGYYALNLTTGTGNSSFGNESGRLLTTGNDNCAFGERALYGGSDATGSWNIAMGSNSLAATTSGSGNVAIGFNSMLLNTTGGFNCAFGFAALGNNTSGNSNLAIGEFSLRINTSGTANCALGTQALRLNITGGYNTACGTNSLFGNTASYNTGIGSLAAIYKAGGDFNIAIGYEAMNTDGSSDQVVTLSNSVLIGSQSRPLLTGDTNEIVIGHTATGYGSNTATIGNNSIIQTVLKGCLTIPIQFPVLGTGVANSSLFQGTDGALYYKGAAGTVTLIGPA